MRSSAREDSAPAGGTLGTPFFTRERKVAERNLGLIARVAAVLAVGLIGYLLLRDRITIDPDGLRAWLIELGPVAPAAYVVVYAAQVVVAPLPGLPIGAAAGFAFGLLPALIYGTIGLAAGALIALVAGRTWGLRLLSRVAGPEATTRWEKMRLINSPVTWLLIFVGPSPDLILFVAGMTRIPLPRLFLIALVGRAPAMIGATLLGAGIVDTGPWLFIGATVIGILIGVGGTLLRRFIPSAGPEATTSQP